MQNLPKQPHAAATVMHPVLTDDFCRVLIDAAELTLVTAISRQKTIKAIVTVFVEPGT